MIEIPIRKIICPSLVAGALFVTVPGFYVGKIIPWRGVLPFWFWLATVALVLGSLFILINLTMKMDGLLAGSTPHGIRFWILFVLSSFFFFVAGFVLTDYFWWCTGKIALASAERDVEAAGFQLEATIKSPRLPDEKNSVYLFNEAWNAPSVRKLGPSTPIYDDPPQGRFEENARKYRSLPGKKYTISLQPFFGKKTEEDFLREFYGDAMHNRQTREEILYAHKLLKEHADAFRLVDKAFEVKNVDWGIDYPIPIGDRLPTVKGFDGLMFARLLRVRALVETMDGNAAGAVKSLETGFFLGHMYGQKRDFMGVMLETAIVRMMTPPAQVVLTRLIAKGYRGSEIIPYLQPEILGKAFFNSMQMEYFGRSWSFVTMNWLDKVLEYHLAAFGYPFIFFDIASLYEVHLQVIQCLNHPKDFKRAVDQWRIRGWLLGSIAISPQYPQMIEKVGESMTRCGVAELVIEADLFHQKNNYWPTGGAELEKWSRDNLGIPSIPEVKVTGAFIENSVSPAGNHITMASKGDVPKTDGSGWLYDSNSGSVYVNSTIRDSQCMAYSFYGFE